ncbi:DUF1648 domain-containing protein [Methanobrevibacter sp. DSM 116169]|uniref:DUF1648 domain-containing protein n=1 Tax=Methanobrevibacter sp. DSM 116169 TaxID=3242727 RepID=UPI0038FD12E9
MNKKIDYNTLILTVIITLSPIILGIIFYGDLPSSIPVHFDVNLNPDMFLDKLYIILIPVFLAILQTILCVFNDLNKNNNIRGTPLEKIFKLIIPVMTILITIIILSAGLGSYLEIEVVVLFIILIILILIVYFLKKK